MKEGDTGMNKGEIQELCSRFLASCGLILYSLPGICAASKRDEEYHRQMRSQASCRRSIASQPLTLPTLSTKLDVWQYLVSDSEVPMSQVLTCPAKICFYLCKKEY